MTQIGFPLDQAHEALDQFLNDEDRDHDGERMDRWIGIPAEQPRPNREYDRVVAHIVGDEHYQRILNGYQQWTKAQEVRDEELDPPSGYTPWKHSPTASMDRLMPVEPLLDVLSRSIFRKPYADLEGDEFERETWHVRSTAIMCLLEVQLDPDGNGAVPILTLSHDPDEPGPGLRWQVACRTGVRGLYVRAVAGFFGDEWEILTGSGYVLTRGWYERQEAEAACAALGRVLPNADWMRLTPDGFTPTAQAAIAAVIKRYRFGPDDSKPDPDVLDEVVPAPSAESAALDGPPAAVGVLGEVSDAS